MGISGGNGVQHKESWPPARSAGTLVSENGNNEVGLHPNEFPWCGRCDIADMMEGTCPLCNSAWRWAIYLTEEGTVKAERTSINDPMWESDFNPVWDDWTEEEEDAPEG